METCKNCVKREECFTRSNTPACDDFVSKEIMTEELKSKFPKQGQASGMRYGKTDRQQRKRLWSEK